MTDLTDHLYGATTMGMWKSDTDAGVSITCGCGERIIVSHSEVSGPISGSNNTHRLAHERWAAHIRQVVAQGLVEETLAKM